MLKRIHTLPNNKMLHIQVFKNYAMRIQDHYQVNKESKVL
jgi:hypothetical protein